jgi:hypothetical protein
MISIKTQKQPSKYPVDQQLAPIEKRRFGPAFEKPCRNPNTIICTARSCQIAYRCRWGMWHVAAHEEIVKVDT